MEVQSPFHFSLGPILYLFKTEEKLGGGGLLMFSSDIPNLCLSDDHKTHLKCMSVFGNPKK